MIEVRITAIIEMEIMVVNKKLMLTHVQLLILCLFAQKTEGKEKFSRKLDAEFDFPLLGCAKKTLQKGK